MYKNLDVFYTLLCIPSITDQGSVQASSSEISLSLSTLARANEQGQLSITTTDCSFNVGDLSINLHGKARYGLEKCHEVIRP